MRHRIQVSEHVHEYVDIDDGLVVNCRSLGIGDALQGLLAVCELKRQHPDQTVAYGVSPAAVPWVDLFDGPDYVTVHEGGAAREVYQDYGRECQEKGSQSRALRRAKSIGVERLLIPKLKKPTRIIKDGSLVVFAPFSYHANRQWPVQSWQTLERLLSSIGYKCVVVGDDAEKAKSFRSQKVLNASPETVATLMLTAKCVIAIDSSPAHFAGLLGAKTVVLCGPTSGESVFGCYPTLCSVQGLSWCDGCYWQHPYLASECGRGCPSMAMIAPQRIADLVRTDL